MQRFLFFVFLFLFVVRGNAQVDSFMLAGKGFKYNIPENWVVQEQDNDKNNSLQWNLILRFVVEKNNLLHKIYVGVIKNTTFEKEQSKKETRNAKKKNTEVKELKIGEYLGINFISSDKPSSGGFSRESENIFIYKLDSTQSLILGYYAFSPIKVGDSLLTSFIRFREDFFLKNARTINELHTMASYLKNTQTDSFLYEKTFFRYMYEPDWKSGNIMNISSTLGSNSITKNVSGSGIEISFIPRKIQTDTTLPLPNKSAQNLTYKDLKNNKPIPIIAPPIKNYYKGYNSVGMKKDTVGNFIFDYSDTVTSVTSLQNIYYDGSDIRFRETRQRTINYLINVINMKGQRYTINFMLTIYGNNPVDETFYYETFRHYIVFFLKENQLVESF